jgi:hypothetical protein
MAETLSTLIIAHLLVSNGSASLDELCDAYPRGLNTWDSEQTRLIPKQRILSAVRTLGKKGIIEYEGDGRIVLNCDLVPTEKLLVIDKCLSRSLGASSLRECLQSRRAP